MRKSPTEAENVLWQQLRNQQISGFIFRRQYNIERFIVDFYCPRADWLLKSMAQSTSINKMKTPLGKPLSNNKDYV